MITYTKRCILIHYGDEPMKAEFLFPNRHIVKKNLDASDWQTIILEDETAGDSGYAYILQ